MFIQLALMEVKINFVKVLNFDKVCCGFPTDA